MCKSKPVDKDEIRRVDFACTVKPQLREFLIAAYQGESEAR